MAPDILARKVRSEAAARRADPEYALRCIEPALRLAETLGPGDRVIWPIDQGGTAWEVLAARLRRKDGGNGPRRIVCVTGDDFPETARLWIRLAKEAERYGVGIVKIRLRSPGGVPNSARSDGNPAGGLRCILIALLDRLRRAVERPYRENDGGTVDLPLTGEPREAGAFRFPVGSPFMNMVLGDPVAESSDSDNGAGGRGRIAGSSAKAFSGVPEVYLDEYGDGPGFFPIEPDIDIRERYLAAEASASAGLLPIVTLLPGEGCECASRHASFARKSLPVLTRVVEMWDAIGGLSAADGTTVLTPVSENDLRGALAWYAGRGGAALIVEPGAARAARIAVREPWTEGRGVTVKRRTAGTAGRIAMIAPGFLAYEASKAADRLSKANLSVTVHSLRFLAPLGIGDLHELAADHDLVCIVDPTNRRGGHLSEAVEAILLKGETPLVLPRGPFDAKSIAEAVETAHRENRFRLAVDDVRRDKWR